MYSCLNQFLNNNFSVKILLRVYRKEQVEYDKTQFFSDVGGAAGLLLGISLTSLFGMLDSLIWLVIQELSFGTYRPDDIAESSN